MQLKPYCSIMIDAASCKRFSRKAWRISLEMVCQAMSNGTSENFIWHHPFSIVVLFERAARATTLSHHPTACLHILSGDPTRGVTSEKCGHVGHVFRRSHTIERRQTRAVFSILVRQHVRIGESRRENVYRNIARAK